MSAAHPVLSSLETIASALKDVADVDPTFMPTADKRAALLMLSRLTGQLDELFGRVLNAADDVAAETGARDAAAWLAHHARVAPAEARRQLRRARSDARWADVGKALGDGEVNRGQAEVITRALDALPDEVGDDTRRLAEQRLVAEAAHFGPRELHSLGRRVLDVVSPTVGEAHEQRQLEREEERAARTTYLNTRRNGDGTTEIRARVSDRCADRLRTYLEALASPRVAGDDRRPYEQRLGSAFQTFLETIDPKRLPLHGGDATTVLVTVDLDTLRSGLGTALIGDEPITASEARRLACKAQIIPAVLGGDSQPLDIGRADRFFKPWQRKAAELKQRTCRAAGCDVPATWCEAHHGGVAWALGGSTDLADLVLLCSFHHHRAHDHRYDHRRSPDGLIEFTRRT